MDIICAKCGKHFSSIETAREHSGHCTETSKGEPIRWIPAPKSEITPEEWESLMKLINPQGISPPEVQSGVEPTAIDTTNAKEPVKANISSPLTNSKKSKTISHKKEAVEKKREKSSSHKIQNWLIALLFIFALSIIGFGISIFIGSTIPFWIFIGFSIIFAVEYWFYYQTRKRAYIGRIYKSCLNISLISLSGLIIWSGIQLFSKQFIQNPLTGSIVFIAELIFFVWLLRVVHRNRRRWPSMKLTIFSLMCLFVIFAFAGVRPFSDYKATLITRYTTWTEEMERSRLEQEAATKVEEQEKIQEAIAMTPISIKEAPTESQAASGLTTTQSLKIEEAEQEAFRLINTIREEAGIPATKWDDELYKLSKQHTQDMANKGELFHTPVGSSHGENAWGGTGYYHYRYDELAKVIVGSWMSSPLHEAWLLHAPIKESVVSIVVTPDGQYASWSFWMNTLDRGPELIERIAQEWRSSGSNLPWIEWLISKGYLKP
ncbi:CAP domain-containing protein [Chloroflexota bacterium]